MEHAIQSIRSFNRFFTRHVGAIDARFLGTDANLAEARLLFEIAARAPVQACALQSALDLDGGYLSRMIARFEKRGWIARERVETNARVRPIHLTPSGRTVYEEIDGRQRAAVEEDLARLDPIDREDLVQALAKVRLLLDPDNAGTVEIRTFRTGDVAQIASRQSRLYAASQGWGHGLEANEAETVATFLRKFNPDREQCWVAEIDGVMTGAVFLTDEGHGIARLRLLHVEPFARRRGIGDLLVRQCIGFAQGKGYREITLWTHTVLETARRIYARNGFECVSSAIHHEFGEAVHGETWVVKLATPG